MIRVPGLFDGICRPHAARDMRLPGDLSMDLAEGQGQADPLRSALKMRIRFGAHLILDVAEFAKMGQQWASLSSNLGEHLANARKEGGHIGLDACRRSYLKFMGGISTYT